MTDSHHYTFFGKNMALIIRSFTKNDPFLFFHMIKRKLNGEWEKLTSKEGKMVKLSLEEIIIILQVVNRERNRWNTEHIYNHNTTEIAFNWEDKTNERLWIFVDKYSKLLSSAEIELFKRLLNHILEEKIEFSTNSDNLSQIDNQVSTQLNEINEKNILIQVQGRIKKSTKKALLIIFKDSMEVWIPKSAIQSDFNPEFNGLQTFFIAHWILQRKGIIP